MLPSGAIVYDSARSASEGDNLYLYDPASGNTRELARLQGDVEEIAAFGTHDCLLTVRDRPRRISSEIRLWRLNAETGQLRSYPSEPGKKYLNLMPLGKALFLLERAQVHIYFSPPFGWEPHGDLEGRFFFDANHGRLSPVPGEVRWYGMYNIQQILDRGRLALVCARGSTGKKWFLAELSPPLGQGATRIARRQRLPLIGDKAIVDPQLRFAYTAVETEQGGELWYFDLHSGHAKRLMSHPAPIQQWELARNRLYYLVGGPAKSIFSGGSFPREVLYGIR